jgi:hypothetical protein
LIKINKFHKRVSRRPVVARERERERADIEILYTVVSIEFQLLCVPYSATECLFGAASFENIPKIRR